jgi:hypothetical protein
MEADGVVLKAVLEGYAQPDPKLVGTIERKNGVVLSYVSHADITRILIEIDPLWSWEPLAIKDGRPEIHCANGMATMWGKLTLLGKTMIGVGSCDESKPDRDKELIGDFLRNASMRFGIALNLWSKQDADGGKRDVTNVVNMVNRAFGTSAAPSAPRTSGGGGGGTSSVKQQNLIVKLSRERNILDLPQYLTEEFGRAISAVGDLSSSEASSVISGWIGGGDAKPAPAKTAKKAPAPEAPHPAEDSMLPDGFFAPDEEPF